MDVIKVIDVNKTYGKQFKLDNVNFTLEEGEYLALVGKNGAGKTTLLRLICGLTRPTEGNVYILGYDNKEIKNINEFVGVVNQYTGLPDLLTVDEFLKYEAGVRKISRKTVDEAIELVDIERYRKKRIGDLSEGTRRKIVIIKALLHNPKILLLDEPTVGLDPIVKGEIWKYLLALKEKKGISAFIATNDLREAGYLCDRVLFIKEGRICTVESIRDIRKTIGGDHTLLVFLQYPIKSLSTVADYLRVDHQNLFHSAKVCEDHLQITTKKTATDSLPILVQILTEQDISISSIATGDKLLEFSLLQLYKEDDM